MFLPPLRSSPSAKGSAAVAAADPPTPDNSTGYLLNPRLAHKNLITPLITEDSMVCHIIRTNHASIATRTSNQINGDENAFLLTPDHG